VPVVFDETRDAARALRVARALAAEGATVTLLHVMEAIPAYAINYVPESFRTEARRAIQEELAVMAEDLPGGRGVVVDGHAGRTILDHARDMQADCIVIASHRPGIQDYLLGSTAAHVVRHAPCSVHVLR
jgi:nucleotide-binding universal stress UspA family protein